FEVLGPDTPCDASPGWFKHEGRWDLPGGSGTVACTDRPVENTDLWIGARINAVGAMPRQFAINIKDLARPEYYYGDVYDEGFPNIGIVEVTDFTTVTHERMVIPSVHTGPTLHHVTTRTAAYGLETFTFRFGWPGEEYQLSTPALTFVPTPDFIIVIQN